MFTGIVTHIGQVVAVREVEAGRELEVASDLPLERIPLGASVAHGGVCLTVVRKDGRHHVVQASPETLARTTLGGWAAGTRLNLEASLRLGDELGGHLVFGHVDGVGQIAVIEPEGKFRHLEVELPEALAPMVAVKGSIAVDGISLTVTRAEPGRFAVAIIPHTWTQTTLVDRRVGDPVNLEIDMLARYVARQLEFARAA